jgi:transposase
MAKKSAKSKKGGRPSKYKDEFCKQAEKLCEQKGYTDKQLAAHFKIATNYIYEWKKKYPEFSEAIRRGKDIYDTHEVESRLLKRALGYSYKEVTKVLSETPDPETGEPRMVVSKEVTKEVIPDVQAIWRWLSCMNSERWPDKQEIVHSFDFRSLVKHGASSPTN